MIEFCNFNIFMFILKYNSKNLSDQWEYTSLHLYLDQA